MRIPQAQEEIINLRNALGVKAFLVREGRQPTTTGETGYALVSRSQGKVNQANEQVSRIAQRYRQNFKALQNLGTEFGVGTNAGGLQELSDTDLKIVSNWTEEDTGQKRTHGSRVKASTQQVPWIWKSFGGGLVAKNDSEDDVTKKIKEYNYQGMDALPHMSI